MRSTDLTANLYFAATVRVAADSSLTRLLPLYALKEPLAPHSSFAQRMLLSLQALGAIEPELSVSNAEDWLTARDWIDLGIETLAWRICWSPGDCRDRRRFAEALLADIEPTESALESLVQIWEDLALAEVAHYADWALAKSGYNPHWALFAIERLREALRSFSVGQVMYFVHIALRSVATTHQQGGVASDRLGYVFADAIGSFSRRAIIEHWTVRGMARPSELPMSAIASLFAEEVTHLHDEYLTIPPSIGALLNAMTRVSSLH